MSMSTSHPTTAGHRWSGPAGMLLAVCAVAAVAWAGVAIATRTGEDAAAPVDRVAAAPAVLNHEVVAPAYSAGSDVTALLEAASWRRYAAGEHAAALRLYAAALSTLTPEIVAPAYSAGSDEWPVSRVSTDPAASSRP